MNRVKVWNDNIYPYTEKFRGDTIIIPPGGHIVMPMEDAVLFKSAFKTPIYEKNGMQKPESFKKIRLEPIPDGVVDVVGENLQELTCQACGFVAKSTAGLASHQRSNHLHMMVDDDARKALAKEGP